MGQPLQELSLLRGQDHGSSIWQFVCNMRRTLFTLLIVCFAASANAQIQNINTTRSGGPTTSGIFSFGPRVSNYSTDVRETLTPLKTGRQSSFGVVGDYRNGAF